MSKRAWTEFGKLRRKYFISRPDAARLFEVSVRTIRNWDTKKAPTWALRVLQRKDRQLGGIDPAWTGFRIGWDGALYGPNRLRVRPDHLRHWALGTSNEHRV